MNFFKNELSAELYQEYLSYFNANIVKRFQKKTFKLYGDGLHDRYLIDLYISNSTIHLKFDTEVNDINLFSYLDVSELIINYNKTEEVSKISPTGFGRCYVDEFELIDNEICKHHILFEGGNVISIAFKTLKIKRL